MNTPPETSEVFDIEECIRDWAERECTSFDEAVDRLTGGGRDENSIWDMPSIDSKRVVGLLVELEDALGRPIPCSVIRPGGYTSVDDLAKDLGPKIRGTTSGAARVVRTSFGTIGLAAAARRPSN